MIFCIKTPKYVTKLSDIQMFHNSAMQTFFTFIFVIKVDYFSIYRNKENNMQIVRLYLILVICCL